MRIKKLFKCGEFKMKPEEYKCDYELGKKVNDYLKEKNVQTPLNNRLPEYANQQKIEDIQNSFTHIMRCLQLDLNDDSLKETPKRVAKMFVNEIFWGLDSHNFPKCTTVNNKISYDEMVLVKDITSISVCEHHFVTIDGKCHIAYIPKDKVLGLSKLNRIVEYFSRRPQIQERLTEQIFFALEFILGTSNIAVVMNGTHFCVKCRGVEDHESTTTTSKLGGVFRSEASLRAEFMTLIK